MAECYCGCGRKIGAFATGRKSANKMGRSVRETLVSIEADVRPRIREKTDDPDARPFAERVDDTVRQGEWFEQDCLKVVHEDMAFGDAPWPAIREWVRDAQGMVNFFRLSPDQQQRIMRSG